MSARVSFDSQADESSAPSATSNGATWAAQIRARARALGFDAVGFASAEEPLDADFERYRAFVDAGMHGEMAWLAENAEARRRVDGDEILQGAKSVVCLARAYQRTESDETRDPATAKLVARYARGRDYHNGVRKKLRQLATFVRSLGEGVRARPLIDDAPILERAWAARAGLGFVGKNGLLIVPGRGSLLLLGEVVTDLELAPDSPMSERCGECTRCIEACPTRAIVSPFVVDARRCVSYLTIELRSGIDEGLRAGVGQHVFGCDDCQTACPFNASTHHPPPGETFRPLERWSTTTLEELLALEREGEAWRALSEGTPLHRATAEGLARNAAIVLGNRGDRSALAALRRAAERHPAALVRDAALWAIARLA